MDKRTETYTKEAYFCDEQVSPPGELQGPEGPYVLCPQPAAGQCGLCGKDLCTEHDITTGRLAARIRNSLNSYLQFMVCGKCAQRTSVMVLVDASKTETFADRKYALKRREVQARDG